MKLVVLKNFNSRMEAEIAKGVLQVNGIESLIAADDEGGMMAYPFTLVKGIRLQVVERDLEEARFIMGIS
jgi:hypothetical protein